MNTLVLVALALASLILAAVIEGLSWKRSLVLEVVNLEKSFPGFDFGPLSFGFEPGRAYGLLGPNGAGKTTLLDLITLQLRPTKGQLLSDGAPIVWGDVAWKNRFSYIRETPIFYDDLRVGETLTLAARLYGHWDRELARRLIDRFHLDEHKKVGVLSRGNRVKLGLVAALAHRAELVILDEPTAGLDPDARSDLQETLRDLKNAQLCLILSSHLFEDLEVVADHVIILRNGKLVYTAPRHEIGNIRHVYQSTGGPGNAE